jgi:hypothetical protein
MFAVKVLQPVALDVRQPNDSEPSWSFMLSSSRWLSMMVKSVAVQLKLE